MQSQSLQRLLHILGYAAVGILIVGEFIDAVSNVLDVPQGYRSALLLVVCLAWLALEVRVRTQGVQWRLASGSVVRVRSVGLKPRIALGSLCIVLAGALVVETARPPASRSVVAAPTQQALHALLPPDAAMDDADYTLPEDLRPEQAFAVASKMEWADFVGAKCVDLFDRRDVENIAFSPPGVAGDACTNPLTLLKGDYFGVIGGDMYCVYRGSEPADSFALHGTLAMGHILIASGSKLYAVGCVRDRSRAYVVEAAEVSADARCKNIVRLTRPIASLYSPMGNWRRDELSGPRVDTLDDGGVYADDDMYRPLWQNQDLAVDAMYAEWAKGNMITLRANGQEASVGDGAGFGGVCSDFPLFIVSRRDWQSTACALTVGTEKLHRLMLSVDDETMTLSVDECTLPDRVRHLLEQPLSAYAVEPLSGDAEPRDASE